MKQINKTADCYFEYLSKSPLFKGFTIEDIELFLNSIPYEIVELNIFDEFSVDVDKSVFVLSGALVVYEFNKAGKKTFINNYSDKDNIFIPVGKAVGYPSVSVIAKRKSILLLMDTDKFTGTNISLMILRNKVQQNIINMFYKMSANTLSRSICNTETQARNKILKLITRLYNEQKSNKLVVGLTRDELADYLQMDTSTLMRELKKLKSEGAIEYNRKYIVIYNFDVLY